jgi:hypothetical protein
LFEFWICSRRDQRRHVKGRTQAWPSAGDGVAALGKAALRGMRREAGKTGRGFSVDRAQFRNFDDDES